MTLNTIIGKSAQSKKESIKDRVTEAGKLMKRLTKTETMLSNKLNRVRLDIEELQHFLNNQEGLND